MSEYIDGDVAEELNIAAEWDGSPKPLEMVTKDDKIVASPDTAPLSAAR